MNEIVVHINKIDELDEVLKVSEIIFKPNKEEKEKYHLKSIWLERINNGLLVSSLVDNKIIGFAVCYKKEDVFHIWNVGVLEEYRKSGVWRKMYDEIVKFSIEKDFLKLTLNTYKNKYPKMFDFAIKEGFEEYRTEFDELSQDTKSMFVKILKNIY